MGRQRAEKNFNKCFLGLELLNSNETSRTILINTRIGVY